MQTTLLTTKLFLPPNRPGWVARPRLLERLTGGWQSGSRLSLVCAPAGFGKSTLAAGWLHSLAAGAQPPAVAWLSLDAGDNHLGVFTGYLVAALQGACAGAGEVTQRLLEQANLPPVENLLMPLLNDLSRVTGRLILALDDYHEISQPDIHAAVAFLVEHLPPAVHIMILTRQDPLLPLARWRARGLMTDLRLRELRFTRDEAAEFLAQSLGIALDAKIVAALEERTEGWIAGLQLAAISMTQSGLECGSGSAEDFLRSFAGNDRFVMDYLVDEVLCRQPEPIQQFLLKTAVLERFNEGLCEAVLEGAGHFEGEYASPAGVLQYLDRANLFLIPLDNRREWYRYHHLFAELLQHRLAMQHGKALAAGLRRRASLWFDQYGLAEEAIRYAQAAADWDLSRELILKYGVERLQNGEVMTMLRWLSALPDAVVQASPALCRYYGYVLTINGRLDLGDRYLKTALQAPGDDPEHVGSALAFASYNACFRGDFQAEIDLAEQALSLIPASDPWIRGIAAVSLGLGLCHHGDPRGCESAMHEAFAAGQRANSLRTCVHALTYLGRISVLRLDFQQAEAYFRQVSQYKVNGLPYSGLDIPLLDLAQLKYEQNRLDEAMQLVNQAMEINQRSGSIEMRAYAYRLAARLNQLTGSRDEAMDFLQKALSLADTYTLSPLTLSLNAAMQVEMLLAGGQLAQAEQAAWRVTNSLGLYSFNFYPEMARVRCWLVAGNRAEAQKLLEPALERAGQPGWEYPRLQVRVLQALAEDSPAKAHEHLREAVALALPGRAVRAFVDLGEPARALLREVLPGLPPALALYASSLLDAFQAETAPLLRFSAPAAKREGQALPAGPAAQQANRLLIEPLTDRELEVIQLLASGLSNVEIAQKLYLSVNTMKAHTQNIYAKLDVHSRVQAVCRARELNLI